MRLECEAGTLTGGEEMIEQVNDRTRYHDTYTRERSYIRIYGDDALRIWRSIYRNRAFTDRGSMWGWAEIDNGVRKVFIRQDAPDLDPLDAARGRGRVVITIGI